MRIISMFSLAFLGCFVMESINAQVVINEYSCSNLSQFADDFGKYEDWIELYNPSTSAVNLGGYYMSDDSLNNIKWTFPAGSMITAGGFLRLWTSGRNIVTGSHYHTNFKLTQTKNNPEFIVFSNLAGTIIDYVKLSKKTHLGHSRGRTINGANGWSVFKSPTPNASNNTSIPYIRYADKPDMSVVAGFYTTSQSISLSTTEINADIYYTTNGNDPTVTSSIYAAPLSVTTTKIIKAFVVSNNPEILPSLMTFNTYFINENHTTVVVSIAGTQLNVLANGTGSLEPNGSFEYFNIEKQRTATTYGQFNRHGQDSWVLNQRSLDFISRDEMAYNHSIEEFLFNWTPRKNFQRIILRAAGDDNYPANHNTANLGSAHMRDAYIHSLSDIGGMHLDVRRSEKAVVYLNGQYWGVYDIRDNPDEHDFTDYYYGQDKYNLQYILTWGSTWAKYGGAQALADWDNLYNFILNNSMANPTNFQIVDDRYDYKSLIDYVIANSFTVCSDWLNWNTGWWRGLDSTGTHLKWGYILWDNDATFDHYINYTGIPSTLPTAAPCNPELLTGSSDPKGHIKVLNRLRQNPEVGRYYISRQIDLWNTVFSCDNMISQLDSTEAIIDPEMARHGVRWAGTYTEWKANVQTLRNFIIARCNFLPTGFINCYSLTGPYNLVIKVDPPDAGSVILNSLPLFVYPWSGTYFGGVETRLAAYGNAGYFFSNWTSSGQSFLPNALSDTAMVNLTGSDTIVAHFTLITGQPQIPVQQQGITVSVYPTSIQDESHIQFELPTAMAVSMKLYSMLGAKISDFPAEEKVYGPGKHNATLSFRHLSLTPGMYLLEFKTEGFSKSFKLVYNQ